MKKVCQLKSCHLIELFMVSDGKKNCLHLKETLININLIIV